MMTALKKYTKAWWLRPAKLLALGVDCGVSAARRQHSGGRWRG